MYGRGTDSGTLRICPIGDNQLKGRSQMSGRYVSPCNAFCSGICECEALAEVLSQAGRLELRAMRFCDPSMRSCRWLASVNEMYRAERVLECSCNGPTRCGRITDPGSVYEIVWFCGMVKPRGRCSDSMSFLLACAPNQSQMLRTYLECLKSPA